MEKNIEKAVKLYSGDRPYGLFVERLPYNLQRMNQIFDDITALFTNAGIKNFEKLPNDSNERAKFAILFKQLNEHLEAARIQGFSWKTLHYEIGQGSGNPKFVIDVKIDETTYKVLALRYKELQRSGSGGGGQEDVPYDIDTNLIEIDTEKIDADYMNSRFNKWLKKLNQPNVDEIEKRQTLDELHKTFATLTQEEQKYANIFLHDVERGEVVMEKGKSFRDYVTEYMTAAKNDQISKLSRYLGLDSQMLRNIMDKDITESNINEFGQFDDLMQTVDIAKAKDYFEKLEQKKVQSFKVRIMADKLLREFILNGGQDITETKA